MAARFGTIPLDAIQVDVPLPFSIFNRIAHQFIVICRAGESFTEFQRHALIGDSEEIFIRRVDRALGGEGELRRRRVDQIE